MGKKIRQQWQNPSTTQREISHSISYNSSKRCIQHEESLHLLWNALQHSCLCVCDAAQNKCCVCCFFFLLSSLWEKPTYYYTWPHQQTSESWSICSYDTLTAEWAPKFYNRKIKLHFLNWWFLLCTLLGLGLGARQCFSTWGMQHHVGSPGIQTGSSEMSSNC